jgi:hypothetical protein
MKIIHAALFISFCGVPLIAETVEDQLDFAKRKIAALEELVAAQKSLIEKLQGGPEKDGVFTIVDFSAKETRRSGDYVYWAWIATIRNNAPGAILLRGEVDLRDKEKFTIEKDVVAKTAISSGETKLIHGEGITKVDIWERYETSHLELKLAD